MTPTIRRALAGCFALAAIALIPARTTVQTQKGALVVTADTLIELREWDAAVTRLERDGNLRLRQEREDTLIAGRTHERFDQYDHGVRVFGGDVARQTAGGLTVSVFGTFYQGINVDPTPELSPEKARSTIEKLAGVEVGEDRLPELVILPRDEGGYTLTYRLRVFSASEGLMMYFIDADTGDVILKFNDRKTQAAVGIARGVLGDDKKISVTKVGAIHHASDQLRPPAITTFDLRGNVSRTISFLNGVTSLGTGDLASDADNIWTDGAAVDAHVYAGWTYDYLFKRFGRRGLDNNNIRILSLVHPVNRHEIFQYPGSIISMFYLNAGYFGDGVMVYGEGLPPNLTDLDGRQWNYTSGGLDIVAHELAHGVTDYSSQLIYLNESGALNEAFSDMMAAAVEFFYQPAGDGVLRADYLIGEDVVTPGGIRSMANPRAYGDPDHYSVRYRGSEDNGGVHVNSGIANHAYYLAIEGGANATSRRSVDGVGAANREQIEKVFYRAFTQLMPSNATFAVARAATIQAARDLYGAGSASERAVTEAWDAVGVN